MKTTKVTKEELKAFARHDCLYLIERESWKSICSKNIQSNRFLVISPTSGRALAEFARQYESKGALDFAILEVKPFSHYDIEREYYDANVIEVLIAGQEQEPNPAA